MKKVKWEVTNGLETYNVLLEVEKVVFRCPIDNVTLTLEIPTGSKSEYDSQNDVH